MFILKHLSQCNDAYLPVACELLMEVIVMSSLCLWPLAELLNTGQFPGSICANNLLVLSEKDRIRGSTSGVSGLTSKGP